MTTKITEENFITDGKTNAVYVSTLLDKVSSGFDKGVKKELHKSLCQCFKDKGFIKQIVPASQKTNAGTIFIFVSS